MTRGFLNYGRQLLDEADIDAVVATLRSDFLTQGSVIERFESMLAERVDARHAVAVSSGTAALHIACLAAGISNGDSTIAPTMTFVATANAPRYCGAGVALADMDAETLGIDMRALEAHLADHPDTKVVLPVHFGGLSSNSEKIEAVSGSAIIIEDACHALGGTDEDNAPVGACRHSAMTVFSFHPVKPITTGEGGAVTTNDEELAHRLKLFRNHGIQRETSHFTTMTPDASDPWWYEQQELGFNYRMNEIQAALGLSQLTRLDKFIHRRREIAAFYDAEFSEIDWLTRPQSAPTDRARSGLHLYQIYIDYTALGMSKQNVVAQLRAKGIGTQVHYIPVHRQPFHQKHGTFKPDDFPNAEAHYKSVLAIPITPAMTDSDSQFVAAEIKGLAG